MTPRPGFQVVDVAEVVRPGDRDRLRYAVLMMPWMRGVQKARRRFVIDTIADELLFPLAQARMGLPPVKPKVQTAAGRKRGPGAGRPPAVHQHVLAGDVERALRAARIRAGRHRVDGQNSPLLDVLAVCWEMVTEAPGKNGVKLKDMRRAGAGRNRWQLTTPAMLGDPLTRAGLGRLRENGVIP